MTDENKKNRIYRMVFGTVYPLYVRKAERKGRTQAEVDEIVCWLTGYDRETLQRRIDDGCDFETFFAEAPDFNPRASLVTGVICGVSVESIEDPVVRKVRCLDKLVDELAKGKKYGCDTAKGLMVRDHRSSASLYSRVRFPSDSRNLPISLTSDAASHYLPFSLKTGIFTLTGCKLFRTMFEIAKRDILIEMARHQTQ